ncbi:MAG: type II/IV secretion system protein [Nitrospiraceae bacterium]|jgi:type II secretory ATPase GspE/PulE/Tfp pilus assembly ATPase PilB-like protein|nr:type II/IV secretion system protein [Nitrospiraceae bacterium]
MAQTTPIRIGDLLLQRGLLSKKQLHVALMQQRMTGDLLGDTLIKLGFVSAKEMGIILAEQGGFSFIDLSEFSVSEEALRMVPKEVAEKAQFIPLELENGRLHIGITNPSNILAIDTVTRLTRQQPRASMVDANSLFEAVERAYYFLENPIQKRIDAILTDMRTTNTAGGQNVSTLTDVMIMDGIRKNATDIHINPAADVVNVFYRIDGVLQHGHTFPKIAGNALTSRLKILSQLDIAEQRLPQDGSFTFPFLSRSYDVRISTIPTIFGENIVLRILAGSGDLPRLERLGFDAADVEQVQSLFAKPHGIILITGPTGSGKTTTLYAALREVNILERNVITVEDPVEYKLCFVQQTQVNEKVGYDFALAGRNFMRQDPDVMLIGEIRDEETAKIAVRASITGHLVLTTLHTNDAVTAIPRLLDLSVDRFLMSSSLLAILAQRLIRKNCPFCSAEYELSPKERRILLDAGFDQGSGRRGAGCPHCSGTGYLGRTCISEIIVINDELRELVYSAASVGKLKEAAIANGMRPFRVDGLKKAVEGVTTIQEVLRVAG